MVEANLLRLSEPTFPTATFFGAAIPLTLAVGRVPLPPSKSPVVFLSARVSTARVLRGPTFSLIFVRTVVRMHPSMQVTL